MKMKKILSAVIAMSMAVSGLVVNVSAASDITFTADQFTVNETNTGFSTIPEGSVFATTTTATYGSAKVYKLDNIFGLAENEYGIEMVAREQRINQPFLQFNMGDADTENDFYISLNAYVGSQRETDYIRLGGNFNYTSGGAAQDNVNNANNFTPYRFFGGNGRVRNRTSDAATSNTLQSGAYQPNNWYNYTISCENKKLFVYVDGVKMEGGYLPGRSNGNKGYNVAGILKDLHTAIRIEAQSGDASLGGAPSFAVFKDAKFVNGTYNAAASSTAVTSTEYTVKANGFMQGATDDLAAMVSVISGIEDDETVGDVLSNITAPANGSVAIVKINDDDKKTTFVNSDEYVTKDMKLLAKAADGSMKLYDLDVQLNESALPDVDISEEAPARYKFDAEDGFTVCDTTVGTLLGYLDLGFNTTAKVTNNDGTVTMTDSDPVTETMKVVVTKGKNSVAYPIAISNVYGINAGLDLAAVENGTILADLSYDGSSVVANTLQTTYGSGAPAYPVLGMTQQNQGGGVAGVGKGSNIITRSEMPTSKVPAYYIQSPDASLWLTIGSKQNLASWIDLNNGTKTIIKYKLYLEEGAEVCVMPYQRNSQGKAVQFSDNRKGDNLDFVGGAIKIAGVMSGANLSNQNVIGYYNNKQEYDITLVEETQHVYDNGGTPVYQVRVDGVYVDGQLLTGSTVTATYGAEMLNQLRQININVRGGNAYIGNFQVYVADDYNPNRASFVENLDPSAHEDADITISSNTLTIDTTTKKITGWTGTAAAVKAAVSSEVNTGIKILDKTGTGEISDSANVENGMLLKVYDIYNKGNFELYELVAPTDWGAWYAVDNGDNTVSLKRNISVFSGTEYADKLPVNVIFASYKGDKLIDVAMQSMGIKNVGTYHYNVTIPATEDATYKAFIWNTDTFEPFEASAPVTIPEAE